MCGRYTLTSSGEELARHFEAQLSLVAPGTGGSGTLPLDFGPRFNIAPTQPVAVVRVADAGDPPVANEHESRLGADRRIASHRWGLIPSWAKDASIGSRMINARSETAAEKPAFREAIRRRRCLVPMTGFYEWQSRGGRKQPSWFHPAPGDDPVWAAAGLWERWWDAQHNLVHTCTVLTTQANAVVAELHDRMPVLLEREHFDRWLDPGLEDAAALDELFVPWPAERTAVRPVSTRVNDARAEGPELLDPPEPPAQGELFG